MKSRVCPFLQRNENLIHQSGIRASRQRVLLRFAHLGGSHHLHCFGDLRGVADRSYPAPYVLGVRHSKLPITALRVASYEGAKSSPDRLEFVERRFQLRLDVLVELLFLADRPEQSSLPRLQPILELQLVLLNTVDGH